MDGPPATDGEAIAAAVEGRTELWAFQAAAANQRILNGEITPTQGRKYLSSFATEGLGMPSHLVTAGEAWLNDVVAAEGGETEDAGPRSAEPRGPHSDLIDRLFAPADRKAAHALAKAMPPQFAGRTEALLTEIARSTDMGPQASYEYVASFARTIGIPADVVTSALDAISAPAVAEHQAAVERELVGAVSPWARNAHAVAEREAAQKEIAKWESAMRADPGTAEWKSYWRDGGDRAYCAALERAAVEVPVMPPAVEAPPAAAPTTMLSESIPASAPAAPPAGQRPSVGHPHPLRHFPQVPFNSQPTCRIFMSRK